MEAIKLLLKYIENNILKYMIYSLLFIAILITSLYINFSQVAVITIYGLMIVIDMISGINRLKQLEQTCSHITKGSFADLNVKYYEEELLKVTIKQITDDYYLKINEIEQTNADFNDYMELWIHEIKLSVANLKNLTENNGNFNIFKEIENVDSSIERILALSSIEQIANHNHFERVLLREVCNKAIKLQMNNILCNEIKIITDCDDSSVIADKYWLTFVLKQIINNSTKYGASSITVSISNNIITISDNGLGIDSGELGLVFDKFYCGLRTKDIVKSTGIGLYLVKVIISSFGYKINLANSKVGLDVIIDFNK